MKKKTAYLRYLLRFNSEIVRVFVCLFRLGRSYIYFFFFLSFRLEQRFFFCLPEESGAQRRRSTTKLTGRLDTGARASEANLLVARAAERRDTIISAPEKCTEKQRDGKKAGSVSSPVSLVADGRDAAATRWWRSLK